MDHLRHRRARIAVSLLVAVSLAGCAGTGMSPQSSASGSNGGTPSFRDKASVRSSLARLNASANSDGGTRLHAQDYASPSNETTADPLVARPNEAPCVVQLFTRLRRAVGKGRARCRFCRNGRTAIRPHRIDLDRRDQHLFRNDGRAVA